MGYDSPPGLAASPPRETGAPPLEPGVTEMSPVMWSTGVEAGPQGLSRFDTPPLGHMWPHTSRHRQGLERRMTLSLACLQTLHW